MRQAPRNPLKRQAAWHHKNNRCGTPNLEAVLSDLGVGVVPSPLKLLKQLNYSYNAAGEMILSGQLRQLLANNGPILATCGPIVAKCVDVWFTSAPHGLRAHVSPTPLLDPLQAWPGAAPPSSTKGGPVEGRGIEGPHVVDARPNVALVRRAGARHNRRRGAEGDAGGEGPSARDARRDLGRRRATRAGRAAVGRSDTPEVATTNSVVTSHGVATD